MKICFVNTNKVWGGGEKWHFQTSLELKRRGHNVTLIVQKDSELANRIKGKLDVIDFPISKLSFLNPLLLIRLKRFFREEQFDAVIMNLPSDVKAFSKPASLAGVPRVVYRRGMNHPIKSSIINRYYYKKFVSHIIANSQNVKESVSLHISELESKVTVIPNGVQLKENLSIIPARAPKLRIGNLGRLVDQKGQTDLIQLGELLDKDGIDFHLWIGGEGELKEKLQSEIKRKNLSERITLLGEVSPEEFFEKIDYFLFPSRFEGFSNAILEAMQFGKPVICYDVASNAEIIQNGKNGFLVEPLNVVAVKHTLLELSADSELYKSIQNEGRSTLKSNFAYAQTIDQLEKLLQS